MPTSYVDSPTPIIPGISGGSTDGSEPEALNVDRIRDSQLRKLGHHTKEFLWVGCPWTCKKRRKHYKAYHRNGIRVSVNQFVYVLAEENKRLVAYLDDIYEDVKGNKMAVVRWFHKIDEVGIDLPHKFNDREIFFSLCLQDLSIECIDGFATVLSPAHYAKFLSEAKHTLLEPYVCCQQYDNDDLKPLDVTQVKGYWKQDLVVYMFSSRALENTCLPDNPWKKEDINTFNGSKPRKRLRLTRDCKMDGPFATTRGGANTVDVIGQTCVGVAQGLDVTVCRKDSVEAAAQHIAVGSAIELLSQDSGIRGCWFRASVIKRHKNKVKLRYHDIKDPENEADCLEEWVLASRIAVHDEAGLRLDGRTTIRPSATYNGKVSWVVDVGTIVDAWWHDGWWEGIVIQKISNEKFQVYFPGEKQEAVFSRSDLRHSREWVGAVWKELSERNDIASSILSDLLKEGRCKRYCSDKHSQTLVSNDKIFECDVGKATQYPSSNLHTETAYKKANNSSVVDLSKDDYLSKLKWESSCKRRRSGFVVQKLQSRRSYGISPEKTLSHEIHREFLIPPLKVKKESHKSVKGDRDICKYNNDSLFSPSVVPPLTSLVMSR